MYRPADSRDGRFRPAGPASGAAGADGPAGASGAGLAGLGDDADGGGGGCRGGSCRGGSISAATSWIRPERRPGAVLSRLEPDGAGARLRDRVADLPCRVGGPGAGAAGATGAAGT